jgi:hypothetical protein
MRPPRLLPTARHSPIDSWPCSLVSRAGSLRQSRAHRASGSVRVRVRVRARVRGWGWGWG